MIAQLRARWQRLTPEQRLAVGVGVPVVAGAAVYQRWKAGQAGEPEPDAEGEEAAASTATMLGYDVSTGVDAGAFGGITDAWNDALAALTGQVEDIGVTAQSAADAAAEAQAAAEAAQAAAEAAQAGGTDEGDYDSGTGTGTGGFVAGARRCTGGKYGWGFQYDYMKEQATGLTRRITAIRAKLATMAAGPAKRQLRAQMKQLIARRQQLRVKMRAWRVACKATRTGGGPEATTLAAYAPGLIVAGPSMGADASRLSAPIPSPTYFPPATRSAGVTRTVWGRR